MNSEIINGEVFDWHFRIRDIDTVFYIGKIYVGTVSKMYNEWSAVSRFQTSIGPVHGFKTRGNACRYLLQVFRLNTNRI